MMVKFLKTTKQIKLPPLPSPTVPQWRYTIQPFMPQLQFSFRLRKRLWKGEDDRESVASRQTNMVQHQLSILFLSFLGRIFISSGSLQYINITEGIQLKDLHLDKHTHTLRTRVTRFHQFLRKSSLFLRKDEKNLFWYFTHFEYVLESTKVQKDGKNVNSFGIAKTNSLKCILDQT